jgi:hypothetical protein
MKILPGPRRYSYAARVGIFLVAAALIVGMGGCDGGGDGYNPPPLPPPSQNLEIRTWYDLDAVRDNLAGNHTLMNDLDSTTAGYDELASPTANQGKGWQPIGPIIINQGGNDYYYGIEGTFDGQGYKICDLFINRPGEGYVGLFGSVDEGGIIKNVGVVNVTVTGKDLANGLVGENNGTVSNSYSSGNVTGEVAVGGLVGYNNEGTVSNSYSTCNVTGEDLVGGLVGWNFYGTVGNSYSSGNVTGEDGVGGLVGYTYLGTVSNSYSTGNVTGGDLVGGLVGENYDTVSNSFWDTETSGQATSAGGTGKTTAQMKNITIFLVAGWNIISVAPGSTNTTYIWNIVNGVTYPFLSWQP